MRYRELYREAAERLKAAGVDSPGPDALVLLEHFFGLNRAGLALHGEEEPGDPEAEGRFQNAVKERAARRPLQYILGSWEFLGLSLQVGEGVLVPREDTAVLVEAMAERLGKTASPQGLDLCAGTGAVGLGLCSLLPGARVGCVELSSQALPYLERNLAAYPQYRAEALRGDVLLPAAAKGFALESLDFIASNPPYVPKGEIPSLQPEVQKEPVSALDGGEDGLAFYRAILAYWTPLLKPGGVLGVEIGEDQGEEVSTLFAAQGLTGLEVRKDWSGLDRAVLGNKPGVSSGRI